ncbi:MAG: hypothetical protein LBG11_09425 [Bifidobacteriaceae bacterium]|jgi:hypothetical protein|nr:hypothetical protein [Bifidobacteriaceae bacterium]
MAKRKAKVVLWYSLMAGAAVGAVSALRWQRRWGATQAEQQRALPGDQLVPQPDLSATRAIGIEAPPSAVWPWLVQMGSDRGGFYNYDWLGRLVGAETRSAESINPNWQDLAQGDLVRITEKLALRVALIEPEKALVLAADHSDSFPTELDYSWAFILEPEGPTGSRLVVRERYAWRSALEGLAVRAVEWLGFLMSRRTLQNIRRRAQDAWLATLDHSLDGAASAGPSGTGGEAETTASATGKDAA